MKHHIDNNHNYFFKSSY